MAEIVKFFLEKLSDILTQEASLLSGVEGKLRILQDRFEWMLVFLKAADVHRGEDEMFNVWVRQIQEVTYHTEDIIDQFMCEMKNQNQNHRRTSNFFLGYFYSCISHTKKIPTLHVLANEIDDIDSRIKEIMVNRLNFSIGGTKSFGESSVRTRNVGEKRAPIVEETNVIGNEDSIREVKSFLMEGEARLVVVSIVGMGGLGKTTLAKKVYESNEIKRSFDCFGWVYVSQQYQLKEVLQGLLTSLRVPCEDQESEEELRDKLHEFLRGSKYLIVVDDIWNADIWYELHSVFPDEDKTSRVLTTTRNKEVALCFGPSRRIHQLRFLNEFESWELFCKKIFSLMPSVDEGSLSVELEELGKKMVAKCGGLPLAIVVLGGFLSRKVRSLSEWSKVNNSVRWQGSSHGTSSNSCMRILKSSYHDLPYYLKLCFLYMGLFPMYREIRASRLFRHWIAEEFIHTIGEETMEDIAEDYLEELIHRSMVQVVRIKSDGRVKTCRVHDTLRDLAIQEAKKDRFFEVYRSYEDFAKLSHIRRLAIHECHLPFHKVELWFSQFRNIRSLICYRIDVEGKTFYDSMCKSLKFLRVLELDLNNDRYITELPEEIGELIHLKYLSLWRTSLNSISRSIARLVNLQTLDLRTTSHETIPSSAIWTLKQLRHLNILGFPCIPIIDKYSKRILSGVHNLTNLQTLRMNSGSWIEGGGLGELRLLRELVIVGSLAPYANEMAESIKKLDTLRLFELHCSEEIPNLMPFSNHKFMYKLLLDGTMLKPFHTPNYFSPNLTMLTLSNLRLEVDPMEVLMKLPKLKILELLFDSYVGQNMVCSKGGFANLQVLQICALKELEEWVVEEGALVSLRCLIIGGCEHLKMLPNGLQHLSTVQELKLFTMPDEFTNRVKENVGDDFEKIKHIPFVNTGFQKVKINDLYNTLREVYTIEDAKYPEDVSMLSRMYNDVDSVLTSKTTT